MFVFPIGFFAMGGGQHDADKVCGGGQAQQQAAGEIRKRAMGAVRKKDVCQIQHIAQAAGQRRHREKRKDDAERRARQRNEKAFARSKCKGRRTTGIMRIKSGSAGAERGMV